MALRARPEENDVVISARNLSKEALQFLHGHPDQARKILEAAARAKTGGSDLVRVVRAALLDDSIPRAPEEAGALKAALQRIRKWRAGRGQRPADAAIFQAPDIPAELHEFYDPEEVENEFPTVSVTAAARRLGISRPTLYSWIRDNKVIAWPLAKAGLAIPAEQFVDSRTLLAGLPVVLEVIPDHHMAWEFLTAESPFFTDKGLIRPIDALKAGRVSEVVDAARSYGEAFS